MIAALYCVKNEEEFLEESLASASRLADIIVLLDDNSTDRTPEIAKSFDKVRYLRSPWSEWHEARNRAFALTEALFLEPDWVIPIDGDEVIHEPESVRSMTESCPPKADPPGAHGEADSIQAKWFYFWDSRETYRVDGRFDSFVAGKIFRVSDKRDALLRACNGWAKAGFGAKGLHSGLMPKWNWRLAPGKRFHILHYCLLTAQRRQQKWEYYNRVDDSERKRKMPDYYDHIIGKPSYFTRGPVRLAQWQPQPQAGRIDPPREGAP